MRTTGKLLLVLLLASALSSCSTLWSSSSALMKIEKGMSKNEVFSLLGEPNDRRFIEEYEQWGYEKTNIATGNNTNIIVDFINGKVAKMDSFRPFDISYLPQPTVTVTTGTTTISSTQTPNVSSHAATAHSMDNEAFQSLYKEFNETPFKDDQLKMLYTDTADRYFTCSQCIQLMGIYTFDDDKLNVLTIVAPRIVDRKNYENIINSLDFISSQDKAKDIFKKL